MATVQGVYLALFGRPADAGGLAYWNGVTKNGADLGLMLKELPALPEYTSRFTGMTNEQIVKSIYQALFGRDPEAKGLAEFTAALDNKTQTISSIAVNILDGAQGTDKARIDAKIAAADIFTAHLDLPAEQTAYNAATIQIAKDYLAGVTENSPGTAASADAAILKMVQQPQGGGTPVGDDAGPNGSPVFTSGGTATVTEGQDINTVVYTAKATDDNQAAVKFSLTGPDAGLFKINESTGVVTYKNVADYEANGATLNIGVRATDSTGFASTKGVVVTVTDVLETATAGNDVIGWAGTNTAQNVDGLGGADTLIGGSKNDTLNGGDVVTVTPAAAATKETVTFTLGGAIDNDDGTFTISIPGNNNDITINYGTNGSNNSLSKVAGLLETALDNVAGYDNAKVNYNNQTNTYTLSITATNAGALDDISVLSENGDATLTSVVTQGKNAVAEIINVTAASDTLTGGGGNDTFVINASSESALDWIKDFSAGDKIATSGSSFNHATLLQSELDYLASRASLTIAVNYALQTIFHANDAGDFITFNWGGDRFLLLNRDGGDDFTNGVDQLIKITGSSHTFVDSDLQ